jgi:hypothetical protein
MFPARTHRSIVVFAFLSILLSPNSGYSQSESSAANLSVGRAGFDLTGQTKPCFTNQATVLGASCNEDDERVSKELLTLGQRGDLIAHTREQALEILQSRNLCSAWFQKADTNPAEVFRSLHYRLDENGPSDIYSMRPYPGSTSFKHPWGASSIEYSGRDSVVLINANGPFFSRKSRVMQLGWAGKQVIPGGWHMLAVGAYTGDTPQARIAIMLHELGHVIGRLPEDNDSWNGRSSRNTLEVLQHCKREIQLSARKGSHFGS